jgi:hypothetical protein
MPAQDVGRPAEALTNLILAESHKHYFLRDRDIEPTLLVSHARYLTELFCHGIIGKGLAR